MPWCIIIAVIVLYVTSGLWFPPIRAVIFGVRCGIAWQLGRADAKNKMRKNRYNKSATTLTEFYEHGFNGSSIEQIKKGKNKK